MDKKYFDHAIFCSLNEAEKFYRGLSDNVLHFTPKWVKHQPIVNYDSYFFGVLANSVASIKTVLEMGHVTDAMALVRNLFDEVIVNLYFMVRLKKKDKEFLDFISDDEILSQKSELLEFHDGNLSEWLVNNKTKELQKSLRYDVMVKYLNTEESMSDIVGYLNSSECKIMRKWLNDAVHLNCYRTILLNDGGICIDDRRKSALGRLKKVFDDIVMFHVTCVFCFVPVYMMSSDYMDYKECGMEPPEGCENEVAPFVQSYLDKTVYKMRPDWAAKIIEVTSPMRLRRL